MNFSVVRGADTVWGKSFARVLAAQKRNLILIGARGPELEILVREIIQNHRVLVHYLVVDDADTGSIIAACEKINDRFDVDLLINYAETGWTMRLDDHDIRSLDRKLKTSHASGILYLHQLLPNLLLHAHARVIDLWCHSQPMAQWEQAMVGYHMRFAEHLHAEMRNSDLQIGGFALPAAHGTTAETRALEILEGALPEVVPGRITMH
ncbi:hypothetical protein GCM10010967_13290 [Dyadobacter beijingensis]|uniref:Short subunit dehydrogenase n=1 Tax=Dyadobacter beijingensis TaxID=365489 RepID=A0ABQ2HIX3_9BACT|nr:SDR family NAD(P)-dependent oxidoreductase [Dyadobacter beijingensis]GGM82902.1 hypothetical protein GCM10010967_13290 [Dyadobacter beijingensis]